MREITLLATGGPAARHQPHRRPLLEYPYAGALLLDAAGLRDGERGTRCAAIAVAGDNTLHAQDYFAPDVGYGEAVQVTAGMEPFGHR